MMYAELDDKIYDGDYHKEIVVSCEDWSNSIKVKTLKKDGDRIILMLDIKGTTWLNKLIKSKGLLA